LKALLRYHGAKERQSCSQGQKQQKGKQQPIQTIYNLTFTPAYM